MSVGVKQSAGVIALRNVAEYATSAKEGGRKLVDKEDLTEWILDKSSPEWGPHRCAHFVLVHKAPTGSETITPFPVPQTGASERAVRVARIVAEVDKTSRAISEQFTVRQALSLEGHFTDDEEEHAYCQYPFSVDPPAEMMTGFEPSTSEQGGSQIAVMGALERTFQTVFKISQANGQQEKDRLAQQVTDFQAFAVAQQERAAEEAKLRLEAFRELERARDAQALREIQVYREKQRADLEHQLLTALGGFAIKVGGGLADKYLPAAPGGEHPLMAFAKGLKPKQLAGLVASLTPEQRAAFGPMSQMLTAGMSEDDQRELLREITEINQRMAESGGSP